MASGHKPVDRSPSQSSLTLNRILADPTFRETLLRFRQINREYDIPYLGGMSEDGSTVYLDRHLPRQLKAGGKTFDPTPYLCDHETFEWSLMTASNWHYAAAHEAATGYERRGVMAAGLNWAAYGRALEPYIKADESEKLTHVPPDLDLRPYKQSEDHKVIHALEAAQGKAATKLSKSEVDYGEGMAKSHCGAVAKWPEKGECFHFVAPSSCERVKGIISPKGWCKLWHHGPKEHDDDGDE